jgi:hypothetical protein
MRSRIRRGAAIRIVVVNRGAEERAGRLLAGNIAFCGGSFGEEVSGSGSVSVSEQEEDDGVESVFPEIGTVFHPEGRSNGS